MYVNYYCILDIHGENNVAIHLFKVIPKKIPKKIPEPANPIHSAARVNHTQHRQNACFADGMSSSSTFRSAFDSIQHHINSIIHT